MADPAVADILVVDDIEAARYSTARILRRAGFAVTEAASGQAALDRVAEGNFDVVVLDVKLPDISGYDVCRKIKHDRPDIMVVHLSATYVSSGHRVKGLDSGADHYLGQPVEAAELVATVGALLRIRAAESALRVSEGRLRAIAETMPQIVWSTRPDGVHEYFNGRWYAYTGEVPSAPPDDADHDGWCRAVDPRDRERAKASWQRSLSEGGPFEMECRLCAGSGRCRWFLVRALPVHDESGGLVRWFGTATDIEDIVEAREVLTRSRAQLESMVTERTCEIAQANERLRRERAFSELLVANSVDGLLAYDEELRYTLWNPAMERISGLPASMTLGRVATELFPFLHGAAEQAMRRALTGETASVRNERFVIAATGREGWYEGDYTPLRTADGAIVGAIAFIRDISERRVVEEQLRQAQKVEALGQLTSGVAHDFNNLLAAIMGNLDLIRRRLPASNSELLSFVDHAIQGAERGAALTQRLLAFARRQDLRPDSVDITELVGGMVELIRRSVGPSITVETRLDDGLWPARVDANQLELAILNLAVNARDAMPMGGALSIAADNAAAVHAGELSPQPGDYVRLVITDSGVGMDEPTLARAIDPFFTTKASGKGTGLGLSMVHGLAAQSGGLLRLSSRPGTGTSAEILLPRAEAEPAREAVVAPAPPARASPLTVLLVEDDWLVALGTQSMIEDLGHAVITTSSGTRAIDILEAEPAIDLVITDHAMPGMTGLELASWIRERRAALPVLLATGYAELPHAAAVDLPRISKPFRQEELAAAIDALLATPPATRDDAGCGAGAGRPLQ